MGLNINEMRAHLRDGGARPTLFRVHITNPIDGTADFAAPFLIQSASLPSYSLGVIQVPFMGRPAHFAGDRQFEPWSVEVINSEDFALRNAFETWNNKIQTLEGNIRDLPSEDAAVYTAQAIVDQLDRKGTVIRSYQFNNVWPMQIGAIQLSWGAVDQLETFPVTFVLDSFRVSGGTTGTPGF
jgi:hypothetical protein